MTLSPDEVPLRFKFESLAFHFLQSMGNVEELIRDMLAKELCHDVKDYALLRKVLVDPMPARPSRDLLVKIVRGRYSLEAGNPILKLLQQDIPELQTRRNRLAHGAWRVSEVTARVPAAHSGHTLAVFQVFQSETPNSAGKQNSLTVDQLDSLVERSAGVVRELKNTVRHFRQKRIELGMSKPIDHALTHAIRNVEPLE